MPFLDYFILSGIGFLGLSIGSFLNSWMWRVRESPPAGGWGVRSKCVSCRRELSWYENIPLVSYVFLRGRCRTCHAVIPLDYFIVELVVPALFLGFTFYHLNLPAFNPWHFFRDIFFGIILIIIFVYDLKYMTILSGVVWAGAVGGFIINYFFLHQSLLSLLIGAAVGGGFFLTQFLVSKGRWIGGGDVRMGVMMGLFLGFPTILVALFVAYIAGSAVAIPLLFLRKKTGQSAIPFGTFLAVGTFVALLWGDQIVGWYSGLIGA